MLQGMDAPTCGRLEARDAVTDGERTTGSLVQKSNRSNNCRRLQVGIRGWSSRGLRRGEIQVVWKFNMADHGHEPFKHRGRVDNPA